MSQVSTATVPDESTADSIDVLNVAAICQSTRALGPGLRAVVWVQGCFFHCPSCIAPEWIPLRPANLVRPENLVDLLLADPNVTGLTFSGGEPMLQAAALARLAQLAKARRELDIVCFTGFQRAYLSKTPPGSGVADLLDQIDVLIDGPYIQRLNDNQGLRGSSNQHIHHLTNKLKGYDFESQPRKAEIHLQDGQAMVVGVPPHHLVEAFNQAIDFAVSQKGELLCYERV